MGARQPTEEALPLDLVERANGNTSNAQSAYPKGELRGVVRAIGFDSEEKRIFTRERLKRLEASLIKLVARPGSRSRHPSFPLTATQWKLPSARFAPTTGLGVMTVADPFSSLSPIQHRSAK